LENIILNLKELNNDVHLLKSYKKYFFNKNINQSFKIKMFYCESIGFFLSLISKIFIKNYKKNYKYIILFWDNLIAISKSLDCLLLNLFAKSLIVIAKKNKTYYVKMLNIYSILSCVFSYFLHLENQHY
jgi:hypothetical protein